ncbi:Crp/Fnr family transcriptional regulator [Roseobacteraceae bacterium NS-SX3]
MIQTPIAPPHPCRQCDFFAGSVWAPADGGALCALSRGFRRRPLAEGEALFEQGSSNGGVFCVSAGLIALRAHRADGTVSLLRLAYPGEVIGFRSFLAEDCHQTEARAVLPSRVCAVPPQGARQVIAACPPVLLRLAARSAQEIGSSRERIIAAGAASNKERLTALLLKLLAAHGERDGECMRMRLPLSRADLADLLGVQRETLSRLITRLAGDGLFTIAGREVRVPAAALTGAAAAEA